MQRLLLSEWQKIIGGECSFSQSETPILHVAYDSRKVYQAEQTMFVAIRTEHNDGHKFIPMLIQAGVKHFLVQELPAGEWLAKGNFLRHRHTVKALQQMTAWWRSQFQYPVLGITGSNGKTIVKEWLYELLSPQKRVVRSPMSFNSQIGVPVSIWQMSERDEIALIEAGISKPGEMQKLADIIRPDIGLFTSIGDAHAEHFPDLMTKVLEKAKLFAHCSKWLYWHQHSPVHKALGQLPDEVAKAAISLGWSSAAHVHFKVQRQFSHQSIIQFSWQGKEHCWELPFTQNIELENALMAGFAALLLGQESLLIAEKLRQLSNLPLRLEIKQGIGESLIINDSYSNDLSALRHALSVQQTHAGELPKALILSDLPDAESQGAHIYAEVIELLHKHKIGQVIGIGIRMQQMADRFPEGFRSYANTAEFLQLHPLQTLYGHCVLVKGARASGLEIIAQALQKQTHDTVLEIRLDRLRDNYRAYRALLPAGVKTMAMVKALSYGAGTHEIAYTLQSAGVDYLAVAYADEGKVLRESGVSLPIMVMHPEKLSIDLMMQYALEPELFSFGVLELFIQTLQRTWKGTQQKLNVHLEFNTGMNRLGFEPHDWPRLRAMLEAHPFFEIRSVFTHLVASDSRAFRAFSQRQIEQFAEIAAQVKNCFGAQVVAHVLNTGGIENFPQACFDMVRLGIGLYGLGGITMRLAPVSKLKTRISQIREVAAGESIGYNRSTILREDKLIATLPTGYADGIHRSLGLGKASFRLGKHWVPTIGQICMDMCMVDISHVPEAREGDEVVIFETADDIHRLARQMDTIPYEVLTGISSRVKRVFLVE